MAATGRGPVPPQESFEVTTAEPAPGPGDFIAEPGHLPVLDAAGAQAAARTGLLLDATGGGALPQGRGPAGPTRRPATIPGAVSAPTDGNVNPDGTFSGCRRTHRQVRRPRRRGRRRHAGRSTGRRLLRLGCHRGPRGPRPHAGRNPRRALRRLLVQLDRRPRPPGGNRRVRIGRPAGWKIRAATTAGLRCRSRSAMACRMSFTVLGRTPPRWLRTRSTVASLTPAWRAISRMG